MLLSIAISSLFLNFSFLRSVLFSSLLSSLNPFISQFFPLVILLHFFKSFYISVLFNFNFSAPFSSSLSFRFFYYFHFFHFPHFFISSLLPHSHFSLLTVLQHTLFFSHIFQIFHFSISPNLFIHSLTQISLFIFIFIYVFISILSPSSFPPLVLLLGGTDVFPHHQLLHPLPMDVSYYLGAPAELLKTVDIVIGSGDIVSIDELPDDPSEIISFLEAEHCGVKYWVLVAQAYAQAARIADAVTIASRGLATLNFSQADKIPLHSVLGWIHLRHAAAGANTDAAISAAEAEFAHVPQGSPTAQLAAAAVAWRRGNADKAAALYDRLLHADSTNCLALMGRAHVALARTRNYAHALRLYQQALAHNPALRPDPRIGVGVCFWHLGDREMAVRAWQRAVQLDPDCHAAHVLLALAEFDDAFTRSVSDTQFVERVRTAMAAATRLNAAAPDDAVVLLALVPHMYAQKRYDLVETLVQRVVRVMAGAAGARASVLAHSAKVLAQASCWLGRVAHARGDFANAQKCFHEAVRLDDASVGARLGLAAAQLGRGVPAEAVLTLEALVRAHPKCAEAVYLLGTVYAHDNKRDMAVPVLERYVRMCGRDAGGAGEPVALRALLELSTLYEQRDAAQATAYLVRAESAQTELGLDVPVEVHNNMGVFLFNRGDVSGALSSFEAAMKATSASEVNGKTAGDADNGDSDDTAQLRADLRVTLAYNIARANEANGETNSDTAVQAYKDVLAEAPHYVSAQLRLLFLDAVANSSPKPDLDAELRALVAAHPADLEVRSFYGWFLRTFGRKVGAKPDADTAHHKETLVAHDSHDCYALMSLANIYAAMARDLRDSPERRSKYYVRAVDLYTKVLSVDPRNVYAAQGLAIVYIENNEVAKGVDVLRKIRDSLNDISVYLNLGHALVELKQFAKAVENYDVALARFTDGSDAKILALLGRAWYLRGLADRSLPYLHRGLEYAEKALAIAPSGSHVFNVAFLQFQIADFVTKVPVELRSVDDINDATANLNAAIKLLNTLAADDYAHPPYPKLELKARAGLGSTLLNRLAACLQETKDSISNINSKLEEAKKFREEEDARRAREQEAEAAEKKAREETLAKERAILQEQAQQWAEESRAVVNDSDDDKAADDKEKKPKKGKKKGKKRKDFINDSDDDQEPEQDDQEDQEDEPKLESDTEPEKKKPKRKRAISDDEDDDEPVEPVKKKKVYKSKEMVEDSSEEENEPVKKKKVYKSKEMVEDSSDDDLF